MKVVRIALASSLLLGLAVAAPVAAHSTCTDVGLGIEVHGHHIVRDYVTGGALTSWPPAGQVGKAIRGSGAVTPGGPGPGFHFPNNFAPGASFCTDSNAPGVHL